MLKSDDDDDDDDDGEEFVITRDAPAKAWARLNILLNVCQIDLCFEKSFIAKFLRI